MSYGYTSKAYSSGILSGALKPKYKLISNLLGGEDFNPEPGVDIFIDLNTFVSALYTSKKYLASLAFADDAEADIVASLVGIALHWKNFSRKWDDVKIYMVMNGYDSPICCEQDLIKSYLLPYKNKMNDSTKEQVKYYLTAAIKLTQQVFTFIPNLYLVTCKSFDSLVFPNVVKSYDIHKRKRIIISGSNLMTGYMFEPNTRVILTKCRHDGIAQIYDPLAVTKSISQINDDVMEVFTKNKVFYNMLNIIIGDFDRGIMGMNGMGISRFATELLRNYEKGLIPQKPKSCDVVLSMFEPMYHQYIEKAYPLVDIKSHSDLVKPSAIEKIKSEQLVDKVDIDGLRQYSIAGINLLELV